MKLAFENTIPVTPIGARTGLSVVHSLFMVELVFPWKGLIKY